METATASSASVSRTTAPRPAASSRSTSLVYMRRHRQRVRAAVLRGAAPLAFTNPLYHARTAQTALDGLLAECARDDACGTALPDLGKEFHELMARLERAPAEVEVAHPETGEAGTIALSRDAFAEALRVMMYREESLVRVPLLLHRAGRGDLVPFAEQALRSNRWIRDLLPFGMLLSVTCAEDVDRIEEEAIRRETESTFLGDVRVRGQKAACEVWPRSAIQAGYGEPVRVDVPTLVLSGSLDPVTPPRWGEETARHLPNSQHVVAPGAHDLRGACIDDITEAFLRPSWRQPRSEGLDTSCVDGMRLAPFAIDG